ncbi:MAG: phosphoribosylanthranilate isomerase [Desulfatibacillaceae bacterium]
MEKPFVQIYEIQRPDEALEMVRLGVDHVGSVLVSARKWRDTAVAETVSAVREAGGVSSLIPLFSGVDEVLAVAGHYRPDIVHLCDTLCDETGRTVDLAPHLALQEALRGRFPGLRIMRTIPIAPPGRGREVESLAIAREFGPLSDLFLTDTWLGRGDPVAGYVGITGRTCDWNVAARLVAADIRPVVLAGGLGPDNVYDGVLRVRPAGVDSCTRTNVAGADGKPVRFSKDAEKVAAFVMEAARAAKAVS